ncbi:MAG: polysaccharide biosynthesis protein [Hyphomicrobiaceae bacterium]|nr:polysaccharide biosynthesis protein [Hyphomicrobiaceae bacterium]
MKLEDFYRGTTVAVTGAAGTVGKSLVTMLLDLGCERVFGLDNNEGDLFYLSGKLKDEPRFESFLCDITDIEPLRYFLSGVDFVFHAAAYKNVPVCERSPSLAVRANILGTENVITAARHNGVRRVLFTSSDKAVNPTNVMGTTKLMGERLITAANSLTKGRGTLYTSTRFGNVAGSRGSVVPVFIQQIAAGGPVTLTDKRMTRFIMTLEEATTLVLQSMVMAKGGEAFVTKMPVFKISDLAQVMIEELAPRFGHKPGAIEIVEIGPRPGEKMYEELITDEEIQRTYEQDQLLAVLPAFRNIYNEIDYSEHIARGKQMTHAYNSANEPLAGIEQIRKFVRSLDEIRSIAGTVGDTADHLAVQKAAFG